MLQEHTRAVASRRGRSHTRAAPHPSVRASASLIAFGVLLLYAASVDVSLAKAAAFLDRAMGAKEHFLTLATLQGGARLRPVVEAGAIAIALLAPEPSLDRESTRLNCSHRQNSHAVFC